MTCSTAWWPRWALALSGAGLLVSGCTGDTDELPANLPRSVDQACDAIDLSQASPSRSEALAARDAALKRMSAKYDVGDAGLGRCGDLLVVVITVRSGEVADSDRTFTQDGVETVLVGSREATLL